MSGEGVHLSRVHGISNKHSWESHSCLYGHKNMPWPPQAPFTHAPLGRHPEELHMWTLMSVSWPWNHTDLTLPVLHFTMSKSARWWLWWQCVAAVWQIRLYVISMEESSSSYVPQTGAAVRRSKTESRWERVWHTGSCRVMHVWNGCCGQVLYLILWASSRLLSVKQNTSNTTSWMVDVWLLFISLLFSLEKLQK